MGIKRFTFITAICLVSYSPACLASAQAADAETAREASLARPAEQDPDALTASGTSSIRRGAFAEASSALEAALSIYEGRNDARRQCETLVMLAQTLNQTGQYEKAIRYMERAMTVAMELKDDRLTALILNVTGNSRIGLGRYDEASEDLTRAIGIADEGGYRDVAAAAFMHSGNLRAAKNDLQGALQAYKDAQRRAELAGDQRLAAMSAVNTAAVAVKASDAAEALAALDGAAARLDKLDDSNAKANGLIKVGSSYLELAARVPDKKASVLARALAPLNEAAVAARRMGDRRTESYAYGYLGKLYEDDGRLAEALDMTRRAVFLAQHVHSAEAMYKWHWQAGRILARLGRTDEAIGSYRNSIHDIQSIREEMASCYANSDASYRKTAGTISLELVNLLLRRASTLKDDETIDQYLVEARDALEISKVYELREYFKDDCLDATRASGKTMEEVSAKAAVVYPVLFSDRVELIVSFSGRLKRYTLPIGSGVLADEAAEFRRKLEKRTTWEFLPHAQRLYDWLIRPLEKDLAESKPETLVFVPDGPLRTIPMGSLHDGGAFLVNRYAIAVTPGLNLTNPGPIDRNHARVLALGLTEPVQGFQGLPYVSDELRSTTEIFGGETLINSEFRVAAMREKLKTDPFSIVHIASHGHFGKNAAETFLLTFDEKFNMDQFAEFVGLFRFRDEPLDMLTLSACETAAGDERAALGLAGVAVRAGANSALATLWHVNDPASYELIAEFYRQLHSGEMSRAAALRAAQVKLIDDIRYDHPGYWAPFLMINNWL